jgi:diguanylate cyclase (GGDEF)-like protein/PAS domain S-box-containing protein
LFDWTVERAGRAGEPAASFEDMHGGRTPGSESAPAVDARYRALVRNLPDAVVAVHDRDLRGVSIDGEALARAGFDRSAFVGRPLRDLIDPADYDRLAGHYRAALEGHQSATELVHATGSVYHLSVVPLRDERTGTIEGVFTVAREITAQKRADAEARQRTAQQSAVAALGVAALEGTPTDRLFELAVEAVAATLDADLSELLELTDDRESLLLRAGVGWERGVVRAAVAPAGSEYYPGFAWGSKGPIVCSDYAGEHRFRATPVLLRHGGVATVAVVVGAKQRPHGVLAVHSRSPRAFRPDELDFLHGIANVLAEAIERETTEDRMRQQALHDPLTGLPNRVLFIERVADSLDRAERGTARSAAVLFVDIDHFKVVNDALGHELGDHLLEAVARRLRAALRPTDTVARVGGDEFVVLCEDVDSEHEALAVGKRLSDSLEEPFKLCGHMHRVTASIGVAIWRSGATGDELMRDADAAMYRAKERGRARCEVFRDDMRTSSQTWLELEGELRDALGRRELSNFYQPIVDPTSGAIAGFEALVRWNHPERGTVPPNEFIPIAEQNGLILELGHAVLLEACMEAAQWPPRSDGTPLRISVNISPRQLSDSGLVDSVQAVLRVSGLAADRLSLEITESAFTDDPARALDVLQRLKQLGVRLELDDFGTGYSSLTYVRMFPIDALKIDRSFVGGVCNSQEDAAIVAAVISMGRALGVNVVAEGVESEAQSNVLQTLGCTLAQGYLFSRPVPAARLRELVADA